MTIRGIPAALAATLMVTAAQAETSLAQYLWHARVLLVFAPDDRDPQLRAQTAAFDQASEGVHARDLVLVPVAGDAQSALRARYGVPLQSFTAILIGKDGGEKQRAATPITPDALFAIIDRMPMRRSEARRRS